MDLLTIVLLTVLIIVGVNMQDAINKATQALTDLNALIASLPVPTDNSADVQAVNGIADGIIAAAQSLKTKYNV